MKTEQTSHEKANCWQFCHFAISWDTKRPYSCRLMGFKSRVLPCFEVFNADGKQCQCFQAKHSPDNVLENQIDKSREVKGVSFTDNKIMNLWV